MKFLSRLWWSFAVAAALAFLLISCSDGPSSPSSPAGGTVYAALGASDALGVGASPLSAGYVFLIADRIAAARGGVDLRNLGIPGAQIDSFVSIMLPRAVEAAPEVISVWTGSNDLVAGMPPDVFGRQLNTLLGDLRGRTEAQIFIGDLIDLTQAPRFRSEPDKDVTRGRVAAFNARISSAAGANGAILVRLSNLPLDDSLFSEDGFHPSNEGYARLADSYWAEIAPRL